MRRVGPQASWAALVAVSLAACGSRVSDPHEAAAQFAGAAGRGDAEAVYTMLDPAAKRSLSRDDVARLVKDERGELADLAHAVTSPEARTRATARLHYADGEEVSLVWTAGTFQLAGAGALPGGAPTPAAALDELRRALARRSYGALLRVLSPTTRAAVEQDLRTLTTGLERPETLFVRTTEDTASAVVPGGHHVTLKREGGLWHVEDFD